MVDNASTDGTGEWLREAAAADGVPLTPLLLPDNRGGAGGFHAGLAAAMERGADLAWLMDDDGVPEPDCLKVLLEHDYDFWGPVGAGRARPVAVVLPHPAAGPQHRSCTGWPRSRRLPGTGSSPTW